MKDIERFINSSIDEFDRTIVYTKTADLINRRDFATRSIDNIYERAFGSLLYMKCWACELTETEYKKLSDKLIAAKFTALKTAWEIF